MDEDAPLNHVETQHEGNQKSARQHFSKRHRAATRASKTRSRIAVSNTTPPRYRIAIGQEHLLGQLFERSSYLPLSTLN